MSSQASNTEKPYYDAVRDESTLTRLSRGKATLATLVDADWTSAASAWGRKQLLAHRVVCSGPAAKLSFLEPWLQDVRAADECLGRLVEGPESFHALQYSSETQIVRRHQPDSLGYVWAAFLPFLRPQVGPSGAVEEDSVGSLGARSMREHNPPARPGTSARSEAGSSGPHSETSDSESSFLSAGYMDKQRRSPSEDAGVRLASCFIRCVLNYGQPVDTEEPFVEFRDERRMYSYSWGGSKAVRAADDGGLQLLTSDRRRCHQVALVEGKRNLSKPTEGVADIPDELLGQMVGQVLALQLTSLPLNPRAARTDFVTILVATHWVKLFHFTNSADYLRSYSDWSNGSGQGTLDGTLRVHSTSWLDLKERGHRKTFASHILALVAWTNDQIQE